MHSPATSPRSRFLLFAVIFGALFIIVRLIYLRQIADSPLLTIPILDSEYYYHWARQLASGGGYPDGPFWLSPFYAFFMAGIFKVFGSFSIPLVVVVQFALSLGTLVLVIAYTQRLFGDLTALWTAALAALYAPWLYYDGILLSASLILFLDALLLWLLITRTDLTQASVGGRTDGKRDALWLLLGLITAASAMTRPSVLIFGGVLVAWQAVRRAPGWGRRTALYLAVIAGLLLPVIVHNFKSVGSVTLTTASGGVNFFIGNRDGASGMYDEMDFIESFDPQREAEGYRAEASRRTSDALTLAEASRYWGRQAARDILANPGGWLRLVIRKAWLTMQREEIANNMSLRGAEGFSPILNIMPLRWALLFPLAAAGAFAGWRRRRDARLLLWYAAAYFSVNLIFFSSSEYRFPMVLALLPAAGCFFVELWKTIQQRDTGMLIRISAVYVAMLIICNFPSREIARAVKPQAVYYNMATVATDHHQTMDAIPLYARSLAVDPDYQPARIGLARALWRIGNYDDARREFSMAGVAAPDEVSGSPLADFLEQLYEHTEANDYISAQALMDSVFPFDRDAPLDVWTNRAMVETGLKRYNRAVAAMLKAAAKDPDSPEWPYKAGRLALLGGDIAQADSLFQASLLKHSAYAPARLELGELALARRDTAEAMRQLEEMRRIRIPDDSLRYRIHDYALRFGQDYPVWTIGQQE